MLFAARSRSVSGAQSVRAFVSSFSTTSGHVQSGDSSRVPPYRRTAPTKIASLASLEQLSEKHMISAWSPELVDHRMSELQRKHNSASTANQRIEAQVGMLRLFDQMHRTGAPLLLQERVFNDLQRHARPPIRMYAALIRAQARASVGHGAWRCEELYRTCAAKYRDEFSAFGIVDTIHADQIVSATASTSSQVDMSVLYAIAGLFESMVTAYCRANQPILALPFVNALHTLHIRYQHKMSNVKIPAAELPAQSAAQLFPLAFARLFATACTSVVTRLSQSSYSQHSNTLIDISLPYDEETNRFIQSLPDGAGLMLCEQILHQAESCSAASVSLYTAVLSTYLFNLQNLKVSWLANAKGDACQWPARIAESIRLRMLRHQVNPDLRFVSVSTLVIVTQHIMFSKLHPLERANSESRSQAALLQLRNWMLHFVASPNIPTKQLSWSRVGMAPTTRTFNLLLRETVKSLKSIVSRLSHKNADSTDLAAQAIALVQRGERLFDEIHSHPQLLPDATTCSLMMELYCAWSTRKCETNAEAADDIYFPEFVYAIKDDLVDIDTDEALAAAWSSRTGIDRATHFLMWLSAKNISSDSHAVCIEALRRAHETAKVGTAKLIEICQQFSLLGIRLLPSTYRGMIRVLLAELQFEKLQEHLELLINTHGPSSIVPSLITDVLMAWSQQPTMRIHAVKLFEAVERRASNTELAELMLLKHVSFTNRKSNVTSWPSIPAPQSANFLKRANNTALPPTTPISTASHLSCLNASTVAASVPAAASKSNSTAPSSPPLRRPVNDVSAAELNLQTSLPNPPTSTRNELLAGFSFQGLTSVLSGDATTMPQPALDANWILVPTDAPLAASSSFSTSAQPLSASHNVDIDSIRSSFESIAVALLSTNSSLSQVQQQVLVYFEPTPETNFPSSVSNAAFNSSESHVVAKEALELPEIDLLVNHSELETESKFESVLNRYQQMSHRLTIDMCHVCMQMHLESNDGVAAWNIGRKYFLSSAESASMFEPSSWTFELLIQAACLVSKMPDVSNVTLILESWAAGKRIKLLNSEISNAANANNADFVSAFVDLIDSTSISANSVNTSSAEISTKSPVPDFSHIVNCLLRFSVQQGSVGMLKQILLLVKQFRLRCSDQSHAVFLPNLASFHSILLAAALKGDVDSTSRIMQAISEFKPSNSTSKHGSLDIHSKTWKLALESHLNAGQIEPALLLLQHMLLIRSESVGKSKEADEDSIIRSINSALGALTAQYHVDEALELFSRFPDMQEIKISSSESAQHRKSVEQQIHSMHFNFQRLHHASKQGQKVSPNPLSQSMSRTSETLFPKPAVEAFLADSAKLKEILSGFPQTLSVKPNLYTYQIMLRALAMAERADDAAAIVENPLVVALFDAKRYGQEQRAQSQENQMFTSRSSSSNPRAVAPSSLPAVLKQLNKRPVSSKTDIDTVLRPRSAFYLEDVLPMLAWHGHMKAVHSAMFTLSHHRLPMPRGLTVRLVRARLMQGDVVGARTLMDRCVEQFGAQLNSADHQKISALLQQTSDTLMKKHFEEMNDDERAELAALQAASETEDHTEVEQAATLAEQQAAKREWMQSNPHQRPL